MEQKIIKIGNSTGVIIPKSLLEKVGLQTGSLVAIEKSPTSNTLSVGKPGADKGSSVTPEFLTRLDKLKQKYGPALKELAEK